MIFKILKILKNKMISPSIDIIIGPMYSGKSSELVRRLNIYVEMGLRVLYCNSVIDCRSSENLSSHNSTLTLGEIHSIKLDSIVGLLSLVNNYDVIGIDEAQFFKGLKEIVLELVEDSDKKVIISGLNGDSFRKPFGEVLELIPYCDEILKLHPFCKICCGRDKIFTKALFSKRIVDNQETIIIGGKDMFIPVCRKCYL